MNQRETVTPRPTMNRANAIQKSVERVMRKGSSAKIKPLSDKGQEKMRLEKEKFHIPSKGVLPGKLYSAC
ncbi:hypothetical protein DPF_1121 [Desulfoplanes formicivorans]|uniref:Uncharacterized protein n=1 Tax=Desulfoplanes formicivorans TaxID=1592317 RepID=A0A194AGG0_9BACT|nr:hypothetical protein DPF_1121 [Desulfoplanes formicivorans]